MKLYPFSALLARMKYITRWSLMHSTRPESLSEHTCDTALLAHTLCLIARRYTGTPCRPKTVAVAALYHDAPEIITGDMPTPVKYYSPGIREAYQKVENVAAEQLLSMLPPALRDSYEPLLKDVPPEVERIVKAADKLSAHIKCLEELKASNHEFILAARQTRQALDEMNMPEVHYFIENFLDSFTLTLDELK